jgi:hypothetical protein
MLSAEPFHCFQKFGTQFCIAHSDTTGFGVYNNIEPMGNFSERPPKYLSKHALNTIPDHSAAYLTGYGYAQPGVSDPISQAK